MIRILASVGSGFSGQILVVQAVAFLLLAWVLKRFALPVLRRALTGRTASIRETYENAERETQKAEAALKDVRGKLALIDEEARRHRETIQAESRHLCETLVAEARESVRAEQEKVRSGIESGRDHAILDIRLEMARLVLERTERLVTEAMDGPMHARLVDRYLRHLDGIPAATDGSGVAR